MAAAADDAQALFRQARSLMESGRRDEAETLLRRIVEREPGHTGALGFLGLTAFQRGELDDSERWLRRALELTPDDALLNQNLGLVFKARGQTEAALRRLEEALSHRPDLPMAHLHRGEILAGTGRDLEAGESLARAVALNPNLGKVEMLRQAPAQIAGMVQSLEDARRRLANRKRTQAIEALAERYGNDAIQRAREFVAVFNGERERDWAHPLQTPSWMYFPDLESRAWFEREEFDWIPELEAAAPRIREELTSVVTERSGISPYVPDSASSQADWRPLAGRTDWGAYHLYRGGERVLEHCRACPETAAALGRLPLMDCPGHAPEAFFSILQPGVHIPPHVGLANTKLAVHLALVIPEGCSITVGGETRHWTEGRVLVFDDSFEHEARNDSDSLRAVLICEIWNPQFSEAERAAVRAVIEVGETLHRHWETVAAETLAQV